MAELVLAGQAALITGGGSGIGLAAARPPPGRRLGTIAGRSRARLDEAAQQLEAEAPDGASVHAAACDVAREDVIAAVAAATEATGVLQLCVASAGTGTVAPVVAMPESEWHRLLDIT